MRLNRKYRLTLEDESSLEKRINFSARLSILFLILIAVVICAGALGVFLLASTPMKNYLPGYLKESERTATEEQHIRLDSLVRVYEKNEAYISGILSALKPSEDEALRNRIESNPTPLTLDSLLPPSDEERNFMEAIRERDKFNINYASPAAAQSLMFGNINPSAVIAHDSKDRYKAIVLLPNGAPVYAVAEGKVISIAPSPASSGGYEVIIQHPKGFLSKSSRLANLQVIPGDRVKAGQIIASSTVAGGKTGNHMVFELWHDGDRLLPAEYLVTQNEK